MKNELFSFAILSFTVFLTACGAPSADSSSVPLTATCTTSPAPTYSGSAAVVFSNNCTSCHSQFGSYSGAASDASNIGSRVSSGSMPQGSALSTNDKNTIIQWVACGTKQ